MSTFIGNHDLPRSIHFAEQTLPAWLGSNARQNAVTTNGSGAMPGPASPRETDPNAYERLANAFAVLLTNRARRSSTTATRLACRARAIRTTGG